MCRTMSDYEYHYFLTYKYYNTMNQYLNFSLEGKVALVTGASYGIGFAIASAFAEQGATICFNDINQELVNKGLAAYAEKGIKVHGYVCDVTDEPAVQAMVAQIEKEVGTIDILVNNAGIIRRVPMHEMEAADFRRVIDIDLNAPFIVSKAVLPAMMKAPNTANTTSSATASARATSQLRRPLRSAKSNPTAAVIRSIRSSAPRLPQAAGSTRRN